MNPDTSPPSDSGLQQIVDRLRVEIDGIIAHLERVRTDLDALEEVNSCAPTHPAVPRRLLTVDEAASALAVCQTTMKRLVSSGEIESRKIGVSRRIPVEALDAFIGRCDGPD